MDTDRLIDSLVDDLRPVRRLASPGRRLLRWLAISVPVVGLIVLAMGIRPDLPPMLLEVPFLAEIGFAAATALTAGWAALAAGVPGTPRWRLALPLLPLTLWLASFAGHWLMAVQMRHVDALALLFDPMCVPMIAEIGFVPAAAMAVMIRHGAADGVKPATLWGMLAATALADVGLRMVHGVDAVPTVIIWQFGSVAVFSALGPIALPRLLAPRAALA